MKTGLPEGDVPGQSSWRHSVVVIIGDLDRGGTEGHLLQVLPALQRRGFSLAVYTLTHRGALAGEFDRQGVLVVQPPFADLMRHLPRWLRLLLLAPISLVTLLRLLWTRQPSIAHCFLPQAYLAGGLCALAARVPMRIMSRRSLNGYQRRHRLLARLEFWLHRHMHWLLGNSRAVLEQLLAEPGVDPQRVSLIYNGIDTDVFSRESERGTVRRKLGVPDSALLLIVVANLIPYKGHADLLKALALVCDDLPAGWQLLCVGRDDGLGADLASRAGDLGLAPHVQWMGTRRDVAALQCAADVGILCSHEEGFSNALLEGMAAGLPMVVTDVGGNREAVLDGKTGYVVPARDPRALGDAIVRLAADEDLRASLGGAARRRVMNCFSIERCVDEYQTLYEQLLNRIGSHR